MPRVPAFALSKANPKELLRPSIVGGIKVILGGSNPYTMTVTINSLTISGSETINFDLTQVQPRGADAIENKGRDSQQPLAPPLFPRSLVFRQIKQPFDHGGRCSLLHERRTARRYASSPWRATGPSSRMTTAEGGLLLRREDAARRSVCGVPEQGTGIRVVGRLKQEWSEADGNLFEENPLQVRYLHGRQGTLGLGGGLVFQLLPLLGNICVDLVPRDGEIRFQRNDHGGLPGVFSHQQRHP